MHTTRSHNTCIGMKQWLLGFKDHIKREGELPLGKFSFNHYREWKNPTTNYSICVGQEPFTFFQCAFYTDFRFKFQIKQRSTSWRNLSTTTSDILVIPTILLAKSFTCSHCIWVTWGAPSAQANWGASLIMVALQPHDEGHHPYPHPCCHSHHLSHHLDKHHRGCHYHHDHHQGRYDPHGCHDQHDHHGHHKGSQHPFSKFRPDSAWGSMTLTSTNSLGHLYL